MGNYKMLTYYFDFKVTRVVSNLIKICQMLQKL